MARENLEDAATTLQEAADAAADGETRERLESQSEQFADHAAADRGPDHGTLARHEHILTEIADQEGGDVAEHVEDALESVRAYRSTVDGV
ncbi:DUF7553 family protein [Natronolimnohabitans innermongolicus]|uniref:Uncharacterized protein n=1 Tax=Natronolimnohabitans innermongolicus JCM 12255 TaxID=1227499 RepID=L9X287_9EURY|nr:hypothetical protein [Natronolimnohabitans innermongolicus]ELY55840.1 hypothetical protein C493_10193 [Natronolimnohabitans innermongolicus JCM 12255]